MTLPKRVVARYSQGMALRPVHRIKHVIDANGVASPTQVQVDLIATVDAPVITSPTQVETGSKVNGIYLKVECSRAAGSALGNMYMAVMKQPAGTVVPPAANAVGISIQKKFVIHQEMIMLGDATENMPRILFNGVIKIPKGYIRNGPSDKLIVLLIAPTSGITINFCLQAHYKEFR